MNKINHTIRKSALLATTFTSVCITPLVAEATNGMFMIGVGTKSNGMGGAGITLSHDVMTSAANPATLSQQTTNRFDIGGDVFSADFTAYLGQGADKVAVKSKSKHATIAEGVYLLPNLGASWSFGDYTYGFTMIPVGGGGSRYEFNLFNCANSSPKNCDDTLGIDLFVVNINPTIAYKVDSQNSIGATLIIGIQQFQAYGLTEFSKFTVSGTSSKLTNNGPEFSYGAGLRIGWLGNFMNEKLKVGAEFTSQTYMSKFDKYTELFAEQGSLNTPGNIGVGISYQANDKVLVAFDINYIMYSGVAAISNATANKGPGSPFPVSSDVNGLGRDEGLGFNWKNQTALKLGIEYVHNQNLTLRGGWNYAKSPINEETDILFSMLAPAITQHHLTLGGTYKLDKTMELSFSYIHEFEYEQFGPTYINFEGGYKMSQDAIGASFGMTF